MEKPIIDQKSPIATEVKKGKLMEHTTSFSYKLFT